VLNNYERDCELLLKQPVADVALELERMVAEAKTPPFAVPSR
jgi:hypothetical protein